MILKLLFIKKNFAKYITKVHFHVYFTLGIGKPLAIEQKLLAINLLFSIYQILRLKAYFV